MTGHLPHLRQVQLALVLVEAGAHVVVVGGTARLLRGTTHIPKDLDIVIARSDAAVAAATLVGFAAERLRLEGGSPQRLLTSWSPMDVFLEDELPAQRTIEIDGTRVSVADV